MLLLYCLCIILWSVDIFGSKLIATTNENWWKNSVIYQIYPRSFKDSNNDGIGDIQGIISKLEHLKDAGITAAWLSPIYKSPQVDQGYDISDYTDIDEDYGTMKDFDEMVLKAHAMGIKIIMDFVPNHSSNKHNWFVKSEASEEEFKDYYVWKDGKGKGQPPNNWKSMFQGSAWTYSNARKQWYLHQFAPEQPDLNYRNIKVQTEMKEVLKFWLDKGVDGFRMDAVPYLVEDETFHDEPKSDNPNAKPEDYEALNHIYTSDHIETYNIIYDWREFIDKYNQERPNEDPRIMMTEAYTSLENTMKYYTDGNRIGAHFTFNFFFITDVVESSNTAEIVEVIDKWITNMPEGCIANWVLGNHDNHRVATRFGVKRVDGMNMLISFLPGVMVTYNGEEIGQENGYVPWEKCQDPRACKGKAEDYEASSRDFERTPFHWDNTVNAGFNEGAEPWLPVSKKYKENNLSNQKQTNVYSHYKTYKSLIKLRQKFGDMEAAIKYEAFSKNILIIIKNFGKNNVYFLIQNIRGKQEIVDLSKFEELNKYIKVVIADSKSNKHERILNIHNIKMEPYESIIAKALSTTNK